MTETTPPGARSPLQADGLMPLDQIEAVLSQECLQAATNAIELDIGKLIYRRLMMRLRKLAATPPPPQEAPAPVTEGAQREAVAWRYVNADGKRLSEWKDGTPSNDEKASAGLLSLYIELAHSPPPDRVQPERVEAEASTDDRKQVAAQYLVVATLAMNIASVHVDFAGGFVSHVPERMLDMLGARSAEIMETLGDILNGMDAVEELDSWTSQIFDRAHERWPVEQSPAPPTDASGGVTEAAVQALKDSLWSSWGASRQTTDWPNMQQLRAALEAADRARKPDVAAWREPTLEDMRGFIAHRPTPSPIHPWQGVGAIDQPDPPRDEVSTPRPADCAAIQSGEVTVLARDAEGNAVMTMRKA